MFYNNSVIKDNKIEEITTSFLPKTVTIPLVQEKQADCKFIVQKGDVVTEGQVLAVTNTKNEVPIIHSPIPGIVEDVTTCVAPYNTKCDAVKIKLQGSFTYIGKKQPESEWDKLSPLRLEKLLSESGVINTFATQNPSFISKDIDDISKEPSKKLLVRLFDEDCSSLIDSILFSSFTEKLLTAISVLAKIIDAEEIVVAYDKHDAKKIDKEIFKEYTGNIPVSYIPFSLQDTELASGRNLINEYKRVNRISLAAKKIAKSFLCVDSSTLLSVYETVVIKKPIETVNLFVSGECLKSSAVLKVPIGTTFQFVAEQCGFIPEMLNKVIVNGNMNGYAVTNLDTPVTKYVKSLCFISKKEKRVKYISLCPNCQRSRLVYPQLGISKDLIYNNVISSITEISSTSGTNKLQKKCEICNATFLTRTPFCSIKVTTNDEDNETADKFYLKRDTKINVLPRPFINNKKPLAFSGLAIIIALLPQLIMLAITHSYNSLILIGACVVGVLLSALTKYFIKKDTVFTFSTSVLQGLLIGFFLPSTFPPLSAFLITFLTMLVIKYCAGGFANSIINSVVIVVLIAYFIGGIYFPLFQVTKEQLMLKNPSLALIENGVFPIYPFDNSITLHLNDSTFALFGISVPNGYVSMLWDTQSIIPAFRFNLLTLIASIVLISSESLEGFVSFIYLFVYTILIKFVGPIITGGIEMQGDVILALLSSGTLFAAFFIIPWYASAPTTILGKLVYGIIGGIAAFLFSGCGTSPIGSILSILVLNLASPFILVFEKKMLEFKLNSLLREENV